jgi:hypothetical protein
MEMASFRQHGIEIQTTPKKMRTVEQIMTSKGKGSNRPEAT